MSNDSTEIYYAEMEAARNTACDAYFIARPHADSIDRRTVFKAGFERAFAMLWHGGRAAQETRERPACDGCGEPATDRCPYCQTTSCDQCSNCEHRSAKSHR